MTEIDKRATPLLARFGLTDKHAGVCLGPGQWRGGIGSVRGALISALLVGLVDTFGKVLLPQVAGMLVYMLMAAVLLWKPEGLFKQ